MVQCERIQLSPKEQQSMCKKQNKKSKISANLVEALLEIAIAIVSFAIGMLVRWMFGVDLNWIGNNSELAVLIGCAVFIFLLIVVCVVINGIKKLIHRNQNDNNQSQQ